MQGTTILKTIYENQIENSNFFLRGGNPHGHQATSGRGGGLVVW